MSTIRDCELSELFAYIKTHLGLELPGNRDLLEECLQIRLNKHGFLSYAEYSRYLVADTANTELHNLAASLMTVHTCFLRNPQHFDFLHEVILPACSLSKDKQLRIWSAGCSTGQEPYTLAMVIQDYLRRHPSPLTVEIIAADLSADVLADAVAGVFPATALDFLPPHWVSEYFTPAAADQYQITPALKQMVTFQKFNLLEKKYPCQNYFDLVFCRNVLMYFDDAAIRQALANLYGALRFNGFLFVGNSELLHRFNSPFTCIRPSIYHKNKLTIDYLI